MKICIVKQDVYQDLYVADNNMSNLETLFSSMMRVGPFGLISDLSADFFILKEEYTEECQMYKQFLKGFGGNYHLLKNTTLNNIPNNTFFSPGSDKPNGYYSVNANSIDWNIYDIVISINFAIPKTIISKCKNTLWCYFIGENNLHLLKQPMFNYDVALNQDIYDKDIDYNSNTIMFPYTFLNKNTLYYTIKNYLNAESKGGIFIEINSCRGRPVSSYPGIFDKLSNEMDIPIILHNQNIKDNLISLYNSKYFIKFGGRPIRGNSVAEAISSNTLVLMDKLYCGYGFLIGDECNITNETELYNKIKLFENDNTKYLDAIKIQKNLLEKHLFELPMRHIKYKWYQKMNTAVVFVSNLPYFGNFINSLIQLREVGLYDGPVVLIAASDIYKTKCINNEYILKYNVEVINFVEIKETLSNSTKEKLITNCGDSGKKNFNWCFGCLNKIHLFHAFFKKYKYILYLDTGIKIYRPLWDVFSLVKRNKILAHHDDFPKYHYSLSDKFRNIEPYKTNLKNEFDLNTYHYFQTTILLYDTDIIQTDTINNILDLVEKYPISCNGDQEYISLYFHQITNQMEQIRLKDNNNYYFYDYYQRSGINKYCMTKL